jgi:coenzyme F420-reducing hydrogenase alpha subunit
VEGHGKVTLLLDEQGHVAQGAAAPSSNFRAFVKIHPGPARIGMVAGHGAAALRHLCPV